MRKRHRPPQAVPHRTRADNTFRALGYLLALIIIVGSAAYLLNGSRATGVETVVIAASMDGFSQNEVTLTRGMPVTIRLISVDNLDSVNSGAEHQWAVDELGLDLIAPPQGTNAITFTPDRPGIYTFYCDICCGGRENPSMQGTLVVRA